MVLALKQHQGKQVQNYPTAYAHYKRNLRLEENRHENMTKPYETTILSSIQTTPRLIQSLKTQYCQSLIIPKSTITPYDCHFFNLYDPDGLVTQQ
jgi:hypothetical protein